MTKNLISITGLTVRGSSRENLLLRNINIDLTPGSASALIGESGSGKTTLALAMIGHLRPGLQTVAGNVIVDGTPVLDSTAPPPSRDVRRIRRTVVAYVSQDPGDALTPTMRVNRLVTELADTARGNDAIAERLSQLFATFGLPYTPEFLGRFPPELSGGQRRRIALIRALASAPRVVILDEPTAGLDPTATDAVVDEISRLRDLGLTVVVVTHDLSVAQRVAHAVFRLADGELTELPRTRPATSPTPVSAVRRNHTKAQSVHDGPPLLSVSSLSVGYHGARDPLCSGLSFELTDGTAVGLTGPSGAGKSTVARAILGLHPPTAGHIFFRGEQLHPTINRRQREHKLAFGWVPQDPATTLNPMRTVASTLIQASTRQRGISARNARNNLQDLMTQVGLESELLSARPRALSGGQRQRVAIARALAAAPTVLICDEITASLDPHNRDRIVELLLQLRDRGLALIVISHDRVVVDQLCHRTIEISASPIQIISASPGGTISASPSRMVRGSSGYEPLTNVPGSP
ncbi:MAG: ABC transporter ATP-binding protein [Rhodococcus sp.]|nr:ABC transporter ATP-binding protein [Rhodococcus sp. (in: high G+C Gram-positive bacteria)]